MSTELEAIASSIGGPEVKSDQLTWNGSVLSRPAAESTASAPVPFWSPTFSVTEDRFTELDEADGLVVLAAEVPLLDDDDDEQPAAASPATASTVTV
jgi:hypothetical protein